MLLILDTPNRIPERPKVVVSDSTTAGVEGGDVRVHAIRGRRPVITVATLTYVKTITPAMGASKGQLECASYGIIRPSEYRIELTSLRRGVARPSRWDTISSRTWSLVVACDTVC